MARGHGLLVFLPADFILSLAKLQAEKELGRSFAGLLALNKGFHALGVLSDEKYLFYRDRYSTKLLERPREELPPVSSPPKFEQLKKREELKELEQYYSQALEQWATMKPKSQEYYLMKAAKDAKRVKAAKLVLDLAPNLETSH